MTTTEGLLLKGIISELPEEQQQEIEIAAQKIRDVMNEHGELAIFSLTMVSLEQEDNK